MKTNASQKYSRKCLLHILEHLYDGDYFYHKKGCWEDWVIAKADVQNAVNKCSDSDKIRVGLLDIDARLFDFIYSNVNGVEAF